MLMLASVAPCAVIGLEGVIVEVEVDTGQGLPGMTILGLPDAAVQESLERVQTAIKNAGLPIAEAMLPALFRLIVRLFIRCGRKISTITGWIDPGF